MSVKVGINGFGRIGRNILRSIIESGRTDIEVVAINDLGPVETNAHLLRYDSVHGKFPATVTTTENTIDAGRGPMTVTAERDPTKLPWQNVDIALECTGIFTDAAKAALHLQNGSKRVLVSAPVSGEWNTDRALKTIVFGVNDDSLDSNDHVVSNASCTTNCLAPVAYVLNEAIGIDHGFMTTIHSYTNDQRMLDQIHKDLRRARAGALNMIPTTTGAARAVGLVLPELKGKLDGSSVRVPTPNVSMVDLVFVPGREVTKEEINAALKQAAEGAMKGVLDFTDQPLVSSDFNHYPASSTVDSLETAVLEGKLARVVSWYDNEWGFSNRMIDTAGVMAGLL